MSRKDSGLCNRSFVFEGFNIPVSYFYAVLEEMLVSRRIPGSKVSHVFLSEGGVFGAKREYLRIRRGAQVFDICAAPFGGSFMVTWWLRRLPSRLWLKCLGGFLALNFLLELASKPFDFVLT